MLCHYLEAGSFAVKDAHKRAGKGDPTERMFRLWMLLGTLEKKKPRRLSGCDAGHADVDRLLCPTAAERHCGWLRWGDAQWRGPDGLVLHAEGQEYSDSNGVDLMMIIRGADIKFVLGDGPNQEIIGVTLQFRKTKVDGERKTFYLSGAPEVCVVTALRKLEALAPQQFTAGSEALKPLFRWSDGQVLKRAQAQNVLQKAAVACGLLAGRFMTHSLRIGGASALFQAFLMGHVAVPLLRELLHCTCHFLRRSSTVCAPQSEYFQAAPSRGKGKVFC